MESSAVYNCGRVMFNYKDNSLLATRVSNIHGNTEQTRHVVFRAVTHEQYQYS